MPDFSGFNIAIATLSAMVFLGLSAQAGAATYAEARQAIVVTTADWDTPIAILQQYERKDHLSPWKPLGGKIQAVVGRHGLGWGAGLHPEPFLAGPLKKEGDGKSPAGIFPLRASFGYADPGMVNWIRLPYRKSTSGLKCIDDPASAHYNRIVDVSSVKPDWKSHEDMARDDDQYRLGIVIAHNTEPAAAGGGSCIFLHIWKASGEGTSGCTAVSAEDIEILLRWLTPESKPLLIQLPEAEYRHLRQIWNLP